MKTNKSNNEPLKFDVHPSVVYKLGDELITDINQALLELIKNSYDADASYVKVTINSTNLNKDPDSMYPEAMGSISIEDNGTGMDINTITNGWLLVSNSGKKQFKIDKKETEKYARTPLGDKGLGRLGAQRLGENLEILTKTEGSNQQLKVSFSWLDFLNYEKLTDVPVHYRKTDSTKKPGTKVLISNLRNFEIWEGESNLTTLEKDLSRILSPYKEVENFKLLVTVNNKRLELAKVSAKLRELSQVRYDLTFDGDRFTIKGEAKLDFFRPDQPNKQAFFSALVENDDGDNLYDFLIQRPKSQICNLAKTLNNKSYVKFSKVIEFDSIDKLARLDGTNANPGSFRGEIDYFNLGKTAYQASNSSVFDRLSEFKNRVKELSGVRVYRDGFNITVDEDWIGFGKGWSDAGSFYGLKPSTTIGYIEISAKDNHQLEETTDREGFKNTPYYSNFYALLKVFHAFADDTQEFLRRGYIDFIKAHNEEELEKSSGPVETEDITEKIKTNVAEAKKHRSKLVQVKKIESSKLPLFPDSNDVIEGLNSTIEYLDKVVELEPAGQVLSDRIESLKQQIVEMHETLGLGLTAEALSHEIFNISDNLAQKTTSIKSYFKKKPINDVQVLTYAEFVNSSTSALRKQVSHLSPSLKYVREKKETIPLSNYFSDSICDFYNPRLQKKNITISVISETAGDFTLYMNRGKLTQIVDNLILNSEYWLAEDIRNKRLQEGIITIKLKKPFVTIEDNGRGIEPSLEAAIFEPFVTNKGNEKAQKKGRGLGLFINRQLLDSEGCHISLLPIRNDHQRLYSFQIDLRGALNER